MNDIKLTGRLTRDPELKTSQKGTEITTFSIANNEYFGEDYVSFFNCIAFGKKAIALNQYFTKGSPILLDGKMKQERWEDKDGNKRTSVVVMVDKFEFMESKGSKPSDEVESKFQGSEVAKEAFSDDDLPF